MQQEGETTRRSEGKLHIADSPRELHAQDIFQMMLEDQSDRLNHIQESPKVNHRSTKHAMMREPLKRLLQSSSSNENLIPELRNDSSMDVEEPGQSAQFETENSQDDQSVRHFKKRAEESFSIEYTSRREDSSESFSERSDSRSHRNQDFVYRMEDEDSRHNQQPKKQFTGCNCKRSKCIKLYCECFHLKVFCTEACKCHSCANRKNNQAEHKKAIIEALTRNPLAFEQQEPEPNCNVFSLGFQKEEIRKGCKCKKTKCLKKYCECYNSGELCGLFCRCEDCENNKEQPPPPND